MSDLNALIDEAHALANGQALETEAVRQLQICNACRYCEGFCAVFPAMTRRLSFDKADLHYMANLCHNCGACLHACQYAPPHDFGVNIPQTMAQLRGRTYQDYAWPQPLATLYRHNGLTLAAALVIALSLFMLWTTSALTALPADGVVNFYDVFPHERLVNLFAPVFILAVFALALGVRRFMADITAVTGEVHPAPPRKA